MSRVIPSRLLCIRPVLPGLLSLVAAACLVACGGGGGGGSAGAGGGDPLVLVDVSTGGLDAVPLNQIVTLEFSEDLDPDSVRPDTIRIRAGGSYGIQVTGDFEVDGNLVRFHPRLPQEADAAGVPEYPGFRPNDLLSPPGSDYRVRLPAAPHVATVRSAFGAPLATEAEAHFRTVSSTAPDLFADNFLDPGPPRIRSTNPADGARDVPAESRIVLRFNRRPLEPSTVNSSNIRMVLEERKGVAAERLVPIRTVLSQSRESVEVELRPLFPLADDATYRLEVERRIRDLVGNDLEVPAGGILVTRFTVRDEATRHSAVAFTFDAAEREAWRDEDATTASWDETEPGALAALFTVAGGNGTAGDLAPTGDLDLDPTDLGRGVNVEVRDGVEVDVYNFRSLEIPPGVTVRFSPRPGGPNRPIVVLSLKDVEIAGTLSVSGVDGTGNGATWYTSYFVRPTFGGRAGPGGGDGADNDTTVFDYPPTRMDGGDVIQGGGGGDGGGSGTYYGGTLATNSTYYYVYSRAAGGGGGGGNRTAGESGRDGYASSAGYWGAGGAGGRSVIERGYPYNAERTPNGGGAGGGAGGKGFYLRWYPAGKGTRIFYGGGGGAGGGGGGGLTLQSAGDVHLAATGSLLADGGAGGDGSSYQYGGGAGGGGAGGSIRVAATERIRLDPGARISVRGGAGGVWPGGTYTTYRSGDGGAGGDGYLRLEAREREDGPGTAQVSGVPTADLTSPPSVGVFAPRGGGAPSIGQTLWRNLGVIDPEFSRPAKADVVATLYNDDMKIEVQMAVEDAANPGSPDLSALDTTDADGDGEFDDTLDAAKTSEWVELNAIEQLNGRHYQFLRVRVRFTLDSTQTASDPLPSLDSLRIPFGF